MSPAPDPGVSPDPVAPPLDPAPAEPAYPEITPDPGPAEAPSTPETPDDGRPYA